MTVRWTRLIVVLSVVGGVGSAVAGDSDCGKRRSIESDTSKVVALSFCHEPAEAQQLLAKMEAKVLERVREKVAKFEAQCLSDGGTAKSGVMAVVPTIQLEWRERCAGPVMDPICFQVQVCEAEVDAEIEMSCICN